MGKAPPLCLMIGQEAGSVLIEWEAGQSASSQPDRIETDSQAIKKPGGKWYPAAGFLIT